MAWEGSWPSIQRHGLLSTEALLDCWEVDDAQKRPLMETHRPEAVTIDHPDFGRATVRDQKPVSDEGLQRCLEGGLEPRDWYRLLNQRVFFWATQERLDALLGARAYRDSRHTVLTVDTSTLVSRYGDEIELTTMNTGCTVPFPHARGLASFTPLRDFDYAASRRKRGRGRAIVEIVVLRGIPDLTDFVVTVEHRGGGLPAKVLFER
jgi:hypothetical protein